MSCRVDDYGTCPFIAPGYRLTYAPVLAVVDDLDQAIVAQFIGPRDFSRPYAERIAALLNTYGAVDDAELTSITDQGDMT